jgi:outer membrane protein assembly factor BamB
MIRGKAFGHAAIARRLCAVWLGGFWLGGSGLGCGEPTSGRQSQVVWSVPADGRLAPALSAARVIFGTASHEVIAVDRTSGSISWRAATQAGGPETQGMNSVVVGDVVAVGDVSIYGFDEATGDERWVFQPSTGDWPGYTRLAADEFTIFAASDIARVYAVDAATGEERWSVTLAPCCDSKAWDPSIKDGVVFVGVRHYTAPITGAFYALDALTGEILWERAFEPELPAGQSSGCLGGAVFHGSNVMVSADDGRIYAFDRATGDTAWIAPALPDMPEYPTPRILDPRRLTVSGNTLVAASLSGHVVALDAATGEQRWLNSARMGSVLVPITSDERRAYVNHTNGQVIGFDLATGAVDWRASRPLWNYPAIDDLYIYQGGFDALFALRKD